MELQQVLKLVLEKLKEALLAVENFGGEALAWFDKVFPPETRAGKIRHWFHVVLPYLIVAAVLTVVVCFCRYCCCCCCRSFYSCCRSFYSCCRYFCCCCCRRRGGTMMKMMKAPGRNCRMPRLDFESGPRSYFSNLRSNPGDQLC